MFGGSKGFAGLGASRPLDPASEIQRLLNQHTAHALALGEDNGGTEADNVWSVLCPTARTACA